MTFKKIFMALYFTLLLALFLFMGLPVLLSGSTIAFLTGLLLLILAVSGYSVGVYHLFTK